ncbi:MAG: N-acetylneuraminate synthase family protein [Phycisphaerales bacterium]|nr:MAG: N-acetylneuraminate synthase family protein [Phycisphaerales bacterium]
MVVAMNVLGIILARAGSKGLPEKCVRELLGRPVIEYTFDHITASRLLTAAVLTTDSEPAKAIARRAGIEVIDRPAELATDTATVDAAARHAVERWEGQRGIRTDIVVLLYGNIPVRTHGLIDRAVEHLIHTGADSVRSVAPVTKHHPDWLHRLDGDRMAQLRPNSIYRRQDLEPLYYHDGAVAAVTRKALFAALDQPEDHQAFLGRDRRALVQRPQDAVDIDEPIDLQLAEAILRRRAGGTASRRDEVQGGFDPVTIGRHQVGPGQRTFVVAEAGVNHNGCLDTALRMVDAAADAGADAVKFQMFRAADLVSASASTTQHQRRGCGETSQRAMLARLELSPEAFLQVKRQCDRRSIMFLATPFGQAQVGHLVELDVRAVKIASTDLTNTPLLETTAATGLPVIVSTGASTEPEIRTAVESLHRMGVTERLILLHCVSSYPTPVEAANLNAISWLRQTFGVPCGFSDHTRSTRIGGWAVAAGACALEKHFTLDPSAPGPDHAVSLGPAQLEEYIASVRLMEETLGTGRPGMTGREAEVRALATKSVVAAVDIPAGAQLAAEMLTVKRPGTGIPAGDLTRLKGRRVAVDIACDTTLSWDMIR